MSKQKESILDIDLIRKAASGHGYRPVISKGAGGAAVMLALADMKEGLSLLFEVRSSRIAQGGEICCPGGRIEQGETAEETVVREASEELLVDKGQIELIAPMFHSVGPGGASVTSVLGFIRDYCGTWSRDEVAEVFAVPLTELFAMEPVISSGRYSLELAEDFPYDLIPGGRDYDWRNPSRSFYFYKTGHGVIWGMTGGLLYSFIEEMKRLLARQFNS